MNRFALVIIGLALVSTSAKSQPLALPDVGSAGVGVFLHRTSRDLELSSGDQLSRHWTRGGVLIHGTVAQRVVLKATVSYEPPHEDSGFPDRIYQGLGFGGGVTVYPLIAGAYRIGASVSYYRHIWHDQSMQRYDKVVDGISVALQAERRFRTRSVNVLIWAGPAYLGDRLSEYPGIWPELQASQNRIGAVGGASFVLWGHVAPYVQIGAVEQLQTHAGVSYVY